MIIFGGNLLTLQDTVGKISAQKYPGKRKVPRITRKRYLQATKPLERTANSYTSEEKAER